MQALDLRTCRLGEPRPPLTRCTAYTKAVRRRNAIMNRLALAVAAAGLFCATPGGTKAGGRFDSKLPKDQQILQVLNRLTFGPRPGDAEEVRRLGVEKWVDLPLQPDRTPATLVLVD